MDVAPIFPCPRRAEANWAFKGCQLGWAQTTHLSGSTMCPFPGTDSKNHELTALLHRMGHLPQIHPPSFCPSHPLLPSSNCLFSIRGLSNTDHSSSFLSWLAPDPGFHLPLLILHPTFELDDAAWSSGLDYSHLPHTDLMLDQTADLSPADWTGRIESSFLTLGIRASKFESSGSTLSLLVKLQSLCRGVQTILVAGGPS